MTKTKPTHDELKTILDNHAKWLHNEPDGVRADLTYATLTGADLSGANLSGADLSGANLSGADLSGANLTGADLRYATLTSADLTGAIIYVGNVRVVPVNTPAPPSDQKSVRFIIDRSEDIVGSFSSSYETKQAALEALSESGRTGKFYIHEVSLVDVVTGQVTYTSTWAPDGDSK